MSASPTQRTSPLGLAPRAAAVWGAALAALGVALGAFGAHGLSGVLSPDRMHTYETAVRYQMLHALGLLVIGALPGRHRVAALLLLAGTLVFSGSLYLLVATGIALLGAVAPIGGAAMIAGWAWLAVGLARGAERA